MTEKNERIMCLDFGSKTIGVALSDPLMLTAQGLEIIRRDEEVAIKKSLIRLGEIIKEYSVTKIVLGYPKNMDNSIGERAEKTEYFKGKLERRFKLPVVLQDERLSTVAADKRLLEADISRKKRKEVIDKMAAVFILQGYLDGLKAKEI